MPHEIDVVAKICAHHNHDPAALLEILHDTQEEFGCVKGHFGPINALAINPNGRNYASGAEDGYVRLHFFDKSYLDMKDPVPEADDTEEGAEEQETKEEYDDTDESIMDA